MEFGGVAAHGSVRWTGRGLAWTADGNQQWTTTRVRVRMRMRMSYTCCGLAAPRDPCFRWLVMPDRHCRPADLGIWKDECTSLPFRQSTSMPVRPSAHRHSPPARTTGHRNTQGPQRTGSSVSMLRALPPSPDPGDGARLLSMTLTVNQRCHSLLTRSPRILVDCQASFAVGMARCRGKRATTVRHLLPALPASRGGSLPSLARRIMQQRNKIPITEHLPNSRDAVALLRPPPPPPMPPCRALRVRPKTGLRFDVAFRRPTTNMAARRAHW
jgi:hypothetical protein